MFPETDLVFQGRNHCKFACSWGLVECCFTSTETISLLGTGAQDGQLLNSWVWVRFVDDVGLTWVRFPSCVPFMGPWSETLWRESVSTVDRSVRLVKKATKGRATVDTKPSKTFHRCSSTDQTDNWLLAPSQPWRLTRLYCMYLRCSLADHIDNWLSTRSERWRLTRLHCCVHPLTRLYQKISSAFYRSLGCIEMRHWCTMKSFHGNWGCLAWGSFHIATAFPRATGRDSCDKKQIARSGLAPHPWSRLVPVRCVTPLCVCVSLVLGRLAPLSGFLCNN